MDGYILLYLHTLCNSKQRWHFITLVLFEHKTIVCYFKVYSGALPFVISAVYCYYVLQTGTNAKDFLCGSKSIIVWILWSLNKITVWHDN